MPRLPPNPSLNPDARRPHSPARCVAFVLLVIVYEISFACDCGSLSLEQRLRESDSVFLGSIVSYKPLASVQLRVHETFKGSPRTTVHIPTGKSDCDYFLPPIHAKPGDRFVIFMSRQKERRSVSRCLGSSPERHAASELFVLRSSLLK